MDGNIILTAFATGQEPLINETKSIRFVIAQAVLKLTCGNFQPWLYYVAVYSLS